MLKSLLLFMLISSISSLEDNSFESYVNYIKEYKKQEEPKFLHQYAADGVTVDEEKWNMNKELVVEKTVEAIFFYEKIQKDIEKELKQYL